MTLKLSGVQLGNITGGPSSIQLEDLGNVSIVSPLTGQYLRYNASISEWQNAFINSDLAGSQGVTINFSAPITTIGLGAITPSSVAAAGSVTGINLSGTNTGDQTITLTGDVTGSGTGSFATTLATVNSNVGTFAVTTVNGKGLVTAATDLSATGDATGTSTGAGIALTLATVNGSPQTDTFRKVTVNGKGLVTATSAVSQSDITTALTYTPLNKAGDTMTGNLILNADPTAALGAVTKQYVDSVAAGLNVHASCYTATTATLAASSAGTVTYNNGASGVGATLTTTGSFATIGGYGTSDGQRILVKNEAAAENNGIYVRTSSTVLTRASDFDNSPSGEIEAGDFTFIVDGTLGGTNWVQTTPSPITVGTTAINFTQLSGPGVYVGGTGINVTSNTISNTGVLSNIGGTGISVSGATGNVTINNTGVTSLTGTSGQVSVSGSTGAITVGLPNNVSIVGTLGVGGAISASNITATAGVASRIVQADGSGYIHNTYFNSSDNSESSGVTAVMVKTGDNYLRSGTAQAIGTFISGTTNQWTGTQNFLSSNAVGVNTQSGTLAAFGNTGGTNAATMSFHRPGEYAINMGLDTDNVFRIGGWSDGASVYRAQFYTGGSLRIGGALYPAGGTNYLNGNSGTYGTFEMVGSKNGYTGVYYPNGGNTTSGMFDVNGNGGDYDPTTSWHYYWNRGDACLGVGGSATVAGYKLNVNGSARVAGNMAVTGESYGTSMRIQSGSPTLAMQDTDSKSAFLHVNSDLIYFLRGAIDATTWDAGPNGRHPMTMNLNNGDVTFSGDVIAYSDIRLKKNVKVIDNALEKVNTLRGVTFDHIETGRGTGLIAQELEKVLPEAVKQMEDSEYLGISYGNTVGLLVEAIKELTAKVESLQAEVNTLRNK